MRDESTELAVALGEAQQALNIVQSKEVDYQRKIATLKFKNEELEAELEKLRGNSGELDG